MRHKWRKRRGFVKIHVAVDTKTKEVLSLEVTDEKVVDHHKFKKLGGLHRILISKFIF